LLTLAVSWLLANAQIPSVIAGATSIAQIEANIAACSWELSAQQLTEINQLS
jgi:aryl-alcohol dehydrogenase-like predicted oxidoreductase